MKRKIRITGALLGIFAFCAAISLSAAEGEKPANPTTTENTTAVSAPKASPANPAAGEQIKWQVIAGGGSRGTSTNFILAGTVGQTAVGKGTSTNFGLNQGFWQDFQESFVCGDANHSGIVNVADVVYLVQYIFNSGPAPNPLASGDVNCNGIVNIADVVYLVQYIFNSGPAPCPTC